MQRFCTKCSKSIAGRLVTCKLCDRSFHPGCVKSHVITKSAKDCCKSQLLEMSLMPGDGYGVHSGEWREPSSSGAGSSSQSNVGLYAASMEALLQSLVNQVKESDVRVSAFIEDQRRTNRELKDKLDKLNNIANLVAQNGQRINKLEQDNVTIIREIQDLKNNYSNTRIDDMNKLVISGVPAVLSITPLQLTRNVFAALDIPDLFCHILDVKAAVGRSPTVITQTQKTDVATASFIISLVSGAVRDMVISRKRVKRVLKQSEVCENGSDRRVFVNELLPRSIYELLRHTRRVAKERYL